MLSLRPATDEDITYVFALRNIPEVYQGYYSNKPITWTEHRTWWASRPWTWKIFIVEHFETTFEFARQKIGLDPPIEKPIGFINIGQLEHWSPEIGYTIHPDYWGKGYGQKAVRLAFKWLRERGYEYCHTTIKNDNDRSMHLAFRVGFTDVSSARENETWLTKHLKYEIGELDD